MGKTEKKAKIQLDMKPLLQMKNILKIIESYNDYVVKFHADNQKIYDFFNKKFIENDEKVEKIISGMDFVTITDKNGALQFAFNKNGEEIYFYLDELISNDVSGFLSKVENNLKLNQDELKQMNTKLDQMQKERDELKPRQPKKLLKFFVDSSDREKCEKEYRLKLNRINGDINDLLLHKKLIENQVEYYEHQKYLAESVHEFISNLTEDEKKLMIQKYKQVEKIFKVDQAYLKEYKHFNTKIPTLSDYVTLTYNVDAKKELFPLIKHVYGLYKDLPREDEYIGINELSKYYDFKEYEDEINALTYAMSDYQFGKITPSRIRNYENEHFIRPAKREKD